METIVISGAVYTKASVLAKRFHYTNDYIGQLCRSGKIKAELVGRSWYADENDLLAHKDTRYKQLREDEIINKIKVFERDADESTLVSVRPRLSKKTVRSIPITPTLSRVAVMEPAKYLPDEAELVPRPRIQPTIPTEIKVDLESAQKVKVKVEGPKKIALEFTEMPMVQLQGNLRVENAELDLETTHDHLVYEPIHKPVERTPEEPKLSPKAPVRLNPNVIPSFTPQLVSQSQTEAPVLSTRFPIILVAFASAIFIFSLLTLTESNLHFEDGRSASQVSFDAASLPLAFAVFRDLFSPQF
jgi:hypothetical protein